MRSSRSLSSVVAVSTLPAWLVVFPAIVTVWSATVRASWAALGRDQGIFQYVAWALAQGDVAYRDVRDVNGPVITMIHAAFLGLGGADEHRFRILDLWVNGLVFGAAGALVPKPSGSRLPWAVAGWVALSAQYVVYGFWDTAQRESFLDWFVLLSIAIGASTRAPKWTFASGALSFVPWLGKPTFAVFTLSQIVALAVDTELGPLRTRLRRMGVFLGGGLLGLAGPALFLLLRADPGAWARITFVDVPTMYRFIWPTPPLDILRFPGYGGVAALATATSAALAALVAFGRLPRRAIPIAAMPVLGLVSVFVQAKGFPYHFHPVTLGSTYGWLVALSCLSVRVPVPEKWRATVKQAAVLLGALLVGLHALLLASRCPDPPVPGPLERDPAALESRLAAFERSDFSPHALRDAATYIASRTTPEDRVQTYGMDAYLLFLAARRSATPYVYAYDLNADAALFGSYSPDGLHPTVSEQNQIWALQRAHARDLMARLERAPPAAFVFIDRSPLMSSPDAVADFRAHCPKVAAWVAEHYRPTAEFDPVHVWLRQDLAEHEPPPKPGTGTEDGP
jgi:hypothetical protein